MKRTALFILLTLTACHPESKLDPPATYEELTRYPIEYSPGLTVAGGDDVKPRWRVVGFTFTSFSNARDEQADIIKQDRNRREESGRFWLPADQPIRTTVDEIDIIKRKAFDDGVAKGLGLQSSITVTSCYIHMPQSGVTYFTNGIGDYSHVTNLNVIGGLRFVR